MAPYSTLIAFEGCDGSGKSTQAELLRQRLTELGYSVVLVAEPGGTPLGESISKIVKSQSLARQQPLDPTAELFLFLAARSQLVEAVIFPALLRRGAVVICDRYMYSSFAYQGYGRELHMDLVQSANDVVTHGKKPDLTFLMDLPPSLSIARAGGQASLEKDPEDHRTDEEDMRRFEEESADFHERVYDGYLKLAEAHPNRWRRIDASLPPEEIAEQVCSAAVEVIGDPTPPDADEPDAGKGRKAKEGEQQPLF